VNHGAFLFRPLQGSCDIFQKIMSEKKYDKDRSGIRQPIPTLVDMEFEDGTFRHEFSENISEGGMYLTTDRPLSKGTKATLRFYSSKPGLGV
jgi:hypothetical protein